MRNAYRGKLGESPGLVKSAAELMNSCPNALRNAERVPVLDLLALRVPLVLLHLGLRIRQVHFQLRTQALLHFQLIRHLQEMISIFRHKYIYGFQQKV